MKNQWENPGVRGRGQYIVGVKALPNGHAFVGSDIFPQLPSLYGILQNKGYFLYLYRASEYYVIYIHWAEKLAKKGKKGRPQQESSRAEA